MRRGLTILILLAAPVAALNAPGIAGGAASSLKPAIHHWEFSFPKHRRSEMRRYSKRHYGINTFKLKTPHVIVEHYAAAGSAKAVRDTFKTDHPDPEFGELPNVCAHFVVSQHGRIHQLVTTRYMCRHTVGLNYTAIGIEHVGFSDGDVVNNPPELRASLKLTRWLRCKYHIKVKNVIGHNESLSSPWHHERVKSMRNQTHQDMRHSTMKKYRAKLRNMPCA
jgi:N-acetylmuramoyl-L-alanine amidase